MSIGIYATLDLAKRRILEAGETDTTNDTLIAELCNEVNGWIESRTHRVLAPGPFFSTTLESAASAADRSVVLVAADGLAEGDVLLFGAVTATPHESAAVESIDGPIVYAAWAADTTYATGATRVPTTPNGHFYTATPGGKSHATTEPTWPTDGSSVADGPDTLVWADSGRITETVTLATPLVAGYAGGVTVTRVYVFDGYEREEGGRVFPIGTGIHGIRSLEVCPVSAGEGGAQPHGAWQLLPRTDYFLRPTKQDRVAGWPATELRITDIPSGGNQAPLFYPGYNNIRVDMDPGWPAVPAEIVDIALKCVVTAFRGRTTAGTDTMRIDVGGTRTFETTLSYQDRLTLDRYTLDEAAIVEAYW